MTENRDPVTSEEMAFEEPVLLPKREAMSLVDPTGDVSPAVLDGIEQVQAVPAAEEAPVGDERVTIMPLEEEGAA